MQSIFGNQLHETTRPPILAMFPKMRKMVNSSTQMNRELEFEWESVNTDIWVKIFLLLFIFYIIVYLDLLSNCI